MRVSGLMLALIVAVTPVLHAQTAPPRRTVAITVDDLPYAAGSMPAKDAMDLRGPAETDNQKLLAAFREHHVPVTGFVIQQSAESFGVATGTGILKSWVARGFDLGNHSYSHSDFNGLSPEQIRQEILRADNALRPLMAEAGRNLSFFRFPYNHTGDTSSKHDDIAAFLAKNGYSIATCSIDTSDYIFNNAYTAMLANKDGGSARRVRDEYLAYSSTEIDYYAGLNRQVLGYEPPEVMLLHDNHLNADTIGEILGMFEKKGYEFVSLKAAQSDAAYRIPDTYITKFGPMWGYRWANERNVKVNGSLETEPPKWIAEYGKK